MKRNPRLLANKEFDLLVVGGGIYGAFIAWDAVLRGLSVALIEKGDFGHATSANSLKTIHGGLRCLQQGDILRMRRLQKEQKAFRKIAPHLIRTMPFLIPTYKRSIYSRTIFNIAFKLRKVLSISENKPTDPQPELSDGCLLSKDQIQALFPNIPDAGLTGSAVFHDCLLHHPERLLLSILHSTLQKGAIVANYMDVVGVLRDKNRITGVRAIDLLTKNEIIIKARMTVNATGPWINRIINLFSGRPAHFPMARGINLITDRRISENFALGMPDNDAHEVKNLFAKKSRLFFIIPWYGYSLIGSHYIPCDKIDDHCPVSESEINEFLSTINNAADLALNRKNVLWAYSGYVSISTNKSGRIKRTQKKQIFDHQKTDGIDGIISVFGMKYTEARYKAEKVVDLVYRKLGEKPPACRTAVTPIYGGDMADMESYVAEKQMTLASQLVKEEIRYLISNYGTRFSEILRYFPTETNTQLGPMDIAEIHHSTEREMAITLEDIMLRRTLRPLISENRFNCNAYAQTMATELNWDEQSRCHEIQSLKNILNRRSNHAPDNC